MKSIGKLSMILLTAAAFAAFPVHAQGEATPTNTPAAPNRVRGPGFMGTVTAVDATAMTVTLKGRGGTNATVTVKVMSDTRITKNRQPALFEDIKEGVRISGMGKKQDDGSWIAGTLHISTRPPRRPAQAAPPDAATPAAPPASAEQK